MAASWPFQLITEDAWIFTGSGFSWDNGRIAMNAPGSDDRVELKGSAKTEFDAAVDAGANCLIRFWCEPPSEENAGPIRISVREGEWRDLDFEEGLSTVQTNLFAGDGSGLVLQGEDDGPVGSITRIDIEPYT